MYFLNGFVTGGITGLTCFVLFLAPYAVDATVENKLSQETGWTVGCGLGVCFWFVVSLALMCSIL